MPSFTGSQGPDALNGGADPDTLSLLDGPDTSDGGGGNDTLSGGGGHDTLRGAAGDDVVMGYGAADETVGAGQIVLDRVASGLSSPLFGVSPPGEPDWLFIVEQHTGQIRILDLNTGAVGATFLDLPDNSLAPGGEQGLLGLAFHPDYASNGKFYVNLTNAAGDTEIREYTRSSADAANPASSRLILTFDQPFENHNGGWMAFGPDGMLYIASGDGGSGGDPQNNGQNINSLLGKMLRIDVNGDDFTTDGNRNYRIPATNPFVGVNGADEVWAYGLRNPWRPSFDSATGDLWIADVGQGAREEVNVIKAGTPGGVNFGWRFKEGFLPYSGTAPAGLTDPILDYGRGADGGQSVTGGYVYHGPGGAQDLYFFADFVSRKLWTVHEVNGQAVDFIDRTAQLTVNGGDFDQVASFAVDGRGRLYVIGLDGDIHRITPGAAAADGGDTLFGDDGNDRVLGGAGFDKLDGGTGADTLVGGAAADWLTGGAGGDTFVVRAASESTLAAADTVFDFENGVDRLDLTGLGASARVTLSTLNGSTFVYADTNGDGTQDALVVASGRGVAGADVLVAGTAGVTMFGDAGANALTGSDRADTFVAGDGADTLRGRVGGDLFYGGGGADTYLLGVGDSTLAAADVSFDFVGGSDRIDVSALAAAGAKLTLATDGSSGFLYIDGNGDGTNDGLFIGYLGLIAGSDLVGGGALTVYGSGNGDTLRGGAVADVLGGFGGADTLIGGGGADQLYGGAGADVFRYEAVGDSTLAAYDYVQDFVSGTDKLDLRPLNATGAARMVTSVFGGSTFVYVDADGNGVQDLLVVLGGVTSTQAGDILWT